LNSLFFQKKNTPPFAGYFFESLSVTMVVNFCPSLFCCPYSIFKNNFAFMKGKAILYVPFIVTIFIFTSAYVSLVHKPAVTDDAVAVKRYLYVAVPGIRDYLGYGGHGILVFDIDNNHRFVKRITTKGFHPDNTPSNVKGIAVSIPLNSIFISTIESLQRIDLATDKLVWEKPFEGGCDRMSISPDGKTMWLPSFEKGFWNVVDCTTGELIKKIDVYKRAHNTIYGPSGKNVYLDDIASPWLYIADAKKQELINKVGPFANFIRPFTINGKETLAYVTTDSLLGFEVGDPCSIPSLPHDQVSCR